MIYQVVEANKLQKLQNKKDEEYKELIQERDRRILSGDIGWETSEAPNQIKTYSDRGEEMWIDDPSGALSSAKIYRGLSSFDQRIDKWIKENGNSKHAKTLGEQMRKDLYSSTIPELMKKERAEYLQFYSQNYERKYNEAVATGDRKKAAEIINSHPDNIYLNEFGNRAFKDEQIQRANFDIESNNLKSLAARFGENKSRAYIDKLTDLSNEGRANLQKVLNNEMKIINDKLMENGFEIYNSVEAGTVEDLQRGRAMFEPGGFFNNKFVNGTEETRKKILDLFDRAIAGRDKDETTKEYKQLFSGLLQELNKNADKSVNEHIFNEYMKKHGWIPTNSDRTYIEGLIRTYAEAPSGFRSEARARLDVIEKNVTDLYKKDPVKHADFYQNTQEFFINTLKEIAWLENHETDPIKKEKELKRILTNIGDFKIRKDAYELLKQDAPETSITTTGTGNLDYNIKPNKTLDKQEAILSSALANTTQGKEVKKNIAKRDQEIYSAHFGLPRGNRYEYDSDTGHVITFFDSKYINAKDVRTNKYGESELRFKYGKVEYLAKNMEWKTLPLLKKTDSEIRKEERKEEREVAAQRTNKEIMSPRSNYTHLEQIERDKRLGIPYAVEVSKYLEGLTSRQKVETLNKLEGLTPQESLKELKRLKKERDWDDK
ncbi:MAG: hypothetical protein FWF38_00525 [Spirochaetaceae bacterium]|nr:hypothetical protein [Spirochaetaceae bacterium]